MIDFLRTIGPLIAAAATGAAVMWGIFKWRHERRAHLTVTLNAGFPVFGGRPGENAIIVTAVNEDPRSVLVSNVSLEGPDGPAGNRAFLPFPPPGATLPGEIVGRARGQTWFEIDGLEQRGFPVRDQQVVTVVETAAGEKFRSTPTVPWRLPVAQPPRNRKRPAELALGALRAVRHKLARPV